MKGGQWERALSLMVERRALDVREEKEAREKSGVCDYDMCVCSRSRPTFRSNAEATLAFILCFIVYFLMFCFDIILLRYCTVRYGMVGYGRVG